MEWADIAITLIWTVVLGGTLGNYATSFVYRLPVNEPMFDKHPFCGSCNTFLKTSDLFPIISYFKNRGKCAYCSAHIPPAHFYVELASIAVMVISYFTLGFGEAFVLSILLGLLCIIYMAISWRSGYSELRILYGIIGLIVAMRLIDDGSIYPLFFDGFIPLLIAALLVRKKPPPHRNPVPMGSHRHARSVAL